MYTVDNKAVTEMSLQPLERSETLTERVYAVIRAAIVDRSLAPGSPVREPVVARQLGVSRTPVREALMKLHEVGLVTFEPNGRAVVVTPSEQTLREAYELREALEGMAAALAAERLEAGALAELRRHAQAGLDAALAGDDASFRTGDAEFHRCVSDVAANERLASYLANARDLTSAMRLIDSPAPGFSVECGRAHVAIAEAIAAGDAARAEAAMRAHIREVREHVLRNRPSPVSDEHR